MLPSPSRIVDEYLIRFAVGVCSGVGGRGMSHGARAGDDADDDVDSEGACRLPKTDPRVCIFLEGILDDEQRAKDGEEGIALAVVVVGREGGDGEGEGDGEGRLERERGAGARADVEVDVPEAGLIYACARCGLWELPGHPRFLRCGGCKSRCYCSKEVRAYRLDAISTG